MASLINLSKNNHGDSMTDRDIENLNFLLSISEAALTEWYAQASLEDIIYAQELLEVFQVRLNLAINGSLQLPSSDRLH